MKTLLSAAAALAIIVSSSAAFAEGGDGPRTSPFATVPNAYAAATEVGNAGSAAEPVFNGAPAVVALNNSGGLSATDSAAPLQTANSAPRGFLNNTAAAQLPVGIGYLVLG